jgi:hypothetical protein
MAAALAFLHSNEVRDLYLLDTFEGMSAPTEADVSYLGESQIERVNAAAGPVALAPLAEVERAMESTHYPPERVHYVQGMVEETLPDQAPEQIAVLRLDTDWYESTKHELVHLWPRVAPGGVLIVDDYGHFAGARRAVDEFFGPKVFLHRIDYTGRLVVKDPT